MTIDTLAAANALQRAGMENGQAQAVANIVRDATADLVTKADLDSALAGLEERLVAQGDKLFSALAAQDQTLTSALAAQDQTLTSALAAQDQTLTSALAAQDQKLTSALAAQDQKLTSALAIQESRLRSELYKALWGFGLGIIGVNIAVVSAAVGVALWIWPPGAG